MKTRIGTSGWSYSHWKGLFYPKDLKQAAWLPYYAEHFNSIEVNNSFYMAPRPTTVETWTNKTPSDFIFAIKAWNLITHKRRLINCEDNLAFFMDCIKPLQSKCGPILFQLPPSFSKNLDRLKDFISILPAGYRYSFEFRHSSWWDEEVASMLSANNIAFCVFELGTLVSPRLVTADFVYVRLHGSIIPYVSNYEDDELLSWQRWIEEQRREAYVYFDNTDVYDHALQNALKLRGFMDDR